MKKRKKIKGVVRKKTLQSNRNYLDPVYKKWRRDVKVRDGYKCQWPGCLSKSRLEVHHIKTWSSAPALRFHIANGITLCNKCHARIRGKERQYEAFFLKILEWQALSKIKKPKRGQT